MPMSVQEFSRRCNGRSFGFSDNDAILSFALDSREAQSGSLFVAIPGERVDGHDYVEDALANGAIGSMSERPVLGPRIVVDSIISALAAMANSFRAEFAGPVVGITGSAGKSSTKELVAAAVSPLGPVLKTEGNRNTEYTVPLAWAELSSEHRTSVIEMSMRGFGQIRHLAEICRPNIGIITNIGYAHAEKVGSIEGVAKAKSELFEELPSNGFAIFDFAEPYAETLRLATQAQVRTFGFDAGADCRITRYSSIDWISSKIEGSLDGRQFEAEVPAIGRHMARNAVAAILAATCAGVRLEDAAKHISRAKLPPMRMETRKLNGATIILDTYNASPASVVAAIETVSERPAAGRKLAVLGEMRELGELAEAGHREVGQALRSYPLHQVVLLGEMTRFIKEEYPTSNVASSIDDVTEFLRTLREGDVVLIKGSRALELEKALTPLENNKR